VANILDRKSEKSTKGGKVAWLGVIFKVTKRLRRGRNPSVGDPEGIRKEKME